MNARVLEIDPGQFAELGPCYPLREGKGVHSTAHDHETQLGKIGRTIRWLEKNGIEVAAFGGGTFRGPRVAARASHRLRTLLAEEAVSRGHSHYGETRIERMEARDPSTGVLIVWEEEVRA